MSSIDSQTSAGGHIEITETLLRLYVFLAQYLDRCLDETLSQSLPEADLQAHLTTTREHVLQMLAVNRVVKGKVEQECARILQLGASCVAKRSTASRFGSRDRPPTEPSTDREALQAERALLRSKTIALSDLLAVFRAV